MIFTIQLISTHICDMASKQMVIEQPASLSTFKKWQNQSEREHQSLLWLRSDVCEHNSGLVWTLQKAWAQHPVFKEFSRTWSQQTKQSRSGGKLLGPIEERTNDQGRSIREYFSGRVTLWMTTWIGHRRQGQVVWSSFSTEGCRAQLLIFLTHDRIVYPLNAFPYFICGDVHALYRHLISNSYAAYKHLHYSCMIISLLSIHSI